MTMIRRTEPRRVALESMAALLARVGANVTLQAPGIEPLRVGRRPECARVLVRAEAVLDTLGGGDSLALAEAYLGGQIDLEGDMLEIMKITDIIDLDLSIIEKLRMWLRLKLRNRVEYDRESIAFHYDRSPEFFLPWLDRWRSYSHGFYRSPDDSVTDAQARKLQFAIDALDLKPGMRVLDMGSGWGCFVEYAGRQGIAVHGITISEAQYHFVDELIRREGLPCTIELINFFEYRPRIEFDGAVFLGTLEHVPEYDRVAHFLARRLKPAGRFYADFSAQRDDFQLGSFMRRYIWPGTITYVDPRRLVRELITAGFNIHELEDDTRSYAYTVRDWALALDANRENLAQRFGEATVRAYRLFLWGSYYFLDQNKTQAYHVVAGRDPAPLSAAS
jgi:cyclopropane-fatty-acyl-phospholipid synthase